MSHVSDSDHRRLEAKVFPDNCVVESHEVSDASRGLRRVPVTRVWRTERLLGRGGFGEVHLQSQESDKDAKRALKVIPMGGMKLSLADCQRELMAMIEFTKPKYRDAAVFVDFIGWFQNDDAMFLAMEYMPLGDLEQNLLQIEKSPSHTGPPLAEEEVQEISRQILEGLKIMHGEGFAHRDLKPQNVFVVQKQPQWWVKLGDFGLSKKRTDGTAYRTQAGTQQYMAPELFYYVQELDTETSEYTNAIDLWSLGCIIYRIMTGAVPFPSLLSLRNYCRDPSKIPLNMPSTMEEAGKFVESLLMPHPAKRPAASAALESRWLTIRNKPKLTLNDIGANFAALNISQSRDNYNTASHKGLQSYLSLPATNDSPRDTATSGPVASQPLPSITGETVSKTIKAKPLSKPQDENKLSTALVDTIKLSPLPITELKPPGSSLHRSTSQPTRSTSTTLLKSISSDELQTRPRKHLSAQAQQVQGHLHSATSEDFIGSTVPGAALEPPLLAMPATEPYIGSAGVRPLSTPKREFRIELNPKKSKLIAEARATERQQPHINGNVVVTADVVAGSRKRVGGRIDTRTVEDTDSTISKVIGEGSRGVDVPDPAKIAPAARKHLPTVHKNPQLGPTNPGQITKHPPATSVERENMKVSEIEGILDSHGVPYYKGLTKSQLLSLLHQAFPVSGAPDAPDYSDAPNYQISREDPLGRLPPGWESRHSRAGEKYYYDSVNNISTWDDPRTTKPNAPVEPHSDAFSLPQRNGETQMPPSIPRLMQVGTIRPKNPPEHWAAESVALPHGDPRGRKYGSTLTGAEKESLPQKPTSAENARNNTQIENFSPATSQKINYWMKALFDFDPQYEGDLRFSKGDLIRVTAGQIGKDPPEGWLDGEVNGRKGKFPSNYCLKVVWMKALYDFDPQFEGDLRLSSGDLIRIIDVPHDRTLPFGWLVGEVNGRSGMFPANFCELVAAAPGTETNGQMSLLTDRYTPNLQLSFITPKDQVQFTQLFKSAVGEESTLSGEKAAEILVHSGLDALTLSHIWALADTTKSGRLYFPEFALAMYLCNMRLGGKVLPVSLPQNMRTEISKLVDWIISHDPDPRHTIKSNAPDFYIPPAAKSTFASQQPPLPQNISPYPQNAFQGEYASTIDLNSFVQTPYYPPDAYVTPPSPSNQPYGSTIPQNPYGPPPPLSQPYGSTMPQDGGPSQPKRRGFISKLLGTQQASDEIHVKSAPFYVFVKAFSGDTFQLRVTRQDTIEAVKRKLEAQEGYRAKDQRLIYAGKLLLDDRTVADYDIRNKCTIHLVTRVGQYSN